MSVEEKIRTGLYQLRDPIYKEFQSKLLPTIDPESIIGIRTPQLRTFSKSLSENEIKVFLKALPHKYYEENNLHGFIIESLNDYDKTIEELDNFLPYIDNWATCDSISPKIFKKHLPDLLKKIKIWIKSDYTYTIRFALGMLMKFYLDENFSSEIPDLAAGIVSDEYYINMMIAWFFATALAKQYDSIIPYFQNQRLSVWTHNKAIQKALESLRITPEQKSYLRTLKIKPRFHTV